MIEQLAPQRYNKNTHKFINDAIIFNTPLTAMMQVDAYSTVQKNTEVEVLETYVGAGGQYNKVFFDKKELYALRKDMQLILKDKIELEAKLTVKDRENLNTIDPFDNPGLVDDRILQFNARRALHYVSILTDYQDISDLNNRAEEVLLEGTRIILKGLGKRYDEVYVKNLIDTSFEFTKVSVWYLPARSCSQLSFIVTLSNKFIEKIQDLSASDIFDYGFPTGAGDASASKTSIMIRMRNFEEFLQHVKKISDVLGKYADLEDQYIVKFRNTVALPL